MPSFANSLQNRLARSRASVERGIKPINNETFARLYNTRPSSPNSMNNSRSVNSNNSELSWGSYNREAWRAQEERELAERQAKQARIAAFLAKAKSGVPTKKNNRSWIKSPTVGGKRKTKKARRSIRRTNRR